MPEILRKRSLSRRTFLKGAGALVFLPHLEAMDPVGRRGPRAPVDRHVFIFAPNGKKMDDWLPAQEGRSFELPHLLEPFAPLRRRLSVLSGLTLDGGRAHGDGPGDHARASASFLTAAHPRKTGGSDIHNGISIDQALVAAMRPEVPFPSLELAMERGRRAGRCDSGYSCAYTSSISWASPTRPLPTESRPREVFARLFGDPQDAASRAEEQERTRRRRRILDLVHEDYKALRRRLGGPDRHKLEEYLEAVDDVQARMRQLEEQGDDPDVDPAVLDGAKGDYRSRLRVMYELLALALETDRTRIVTFMLGNAGSNRSYRVVGVSGGHHTLSHHGKEAAKLEAIRKINRFHTEEFARFLQGLARRRDGDGDLLSSCAVLYGSGLSDGNRHDHADLPILLAGELNGALRPGAHQRFPKETPLADLYLWMLRRQDPRSRSFADARGPLFG